MIYDFNVQEPYKSFLFTWQKTIEWRLKKWKFLSMTIWDILQFPSWEQFLIENITEHKTFMEMIQKFGKESIIPDAINDVSANNVYYKFYTPEDEKKFGVLALHVKKIYVKKMLLK